MQKQNIPAYKLKKPVIRARTTPLFSKRPYLIEYSLFVSIKKYESLSKGYMACLDTYKFEKYSGFPVNCITSTSVNYKSHELMYYFLKLFINTIMNQEKHKNVGIKTAKALLKMLPESLKNMTCKRKTDSTCLS